jgi:hypothetical protein
MAIPAGNAPARQKRPAEPEYKKALASLLYPILTGDFFCDKYAGERICSWPSPTEEAHHPKNPIDACLLE